METSQTVEWPEGEETDSGLRYNPRSPASVLLASEELRDRLGLDYLPILCNEPKRKSGFLSRLRAGVGRLLRRSR
jgi:hypothetical protein